jgi:hypothetical protein
VATIDGGVVEPEARRIAHACCVVHWLDLNRILSTPDRCAGCGKPDTPGNLLPYGAEPMGGAWLHPRCWLDWHTRRRAEAITALATLGIDDGGGSAP